MEPSRIRYRRAHPEMSRMMIVPGNECAAALITYEFDAGRILEPLRFGWIQARMALAILFTVRVGAMSQSGRMVLRLGHIRAVSRPMRTGVEANGLW